MSYSGDIDDIILSTDDDAVIVEQYSRIGPDGKVNNFIDLRMRNGEIAYLTVAGNNSSAAKNYNFIVTNQAEDATTSERIHLAAGVWDITDTILSKDCGFSYAAQSVYQASSEQIGRLLSISSSLTSTELDKVFLTAYQKS